MKFPILLAAAALAACSTSQTQQVNKVIAAGQLYCGVATATGPLVVALADASGVPITVTNKAADVVARACAVVQGIPVVPPPNPAAAPVVAAPIAMALNAPR